MDNLLKSVPKEIKKIFSDKKNKNAGVGALLGYLLTSDETKQTRNAILGGLTGYLLTAYSEKKEE